MHLLNCSARPLASLAQWGAGGWRAHVAALAAGWLLLLCPRPARPSRPPSAAHIAAGGVLLLVALLLLGPLLAALQPLLRSLGALGGETWLALVFGLFNAWRYREGRVALSAMRGLG